MPTLRPAPHGFKITALVISIEINKWSRLIGERPHLPQYTDIDSAHELLAQDIEAVSDVVIENKVVVGEGAKAEVVVVGVVVVEGLAEEIEAVEVVETFDVGGITTTVLRINMYVSCGMETGGLGQGVRDEDGAV